MCISLGGKHNQPTVSFTNPSFLSHKKFATNSAFQMIPGFVRSHQGQRALVVIIDDFETEVILSKNIRIIQDTLDEYPHIDVVLYNQILHIDTISDQTREWIDLAVQLNIPPGNFHILNFIKFRGCCRVDISQFEYELPRMIQRVLTQTRIYSDSLYIWFGYHYYTYHLAYSYRFYNMSSHLKILRILYDFGDLTPLVNSNIYQLLKYPAANYARNQTVLREFIENVIDFTSIQPVSIDSDFR